VVPLLASPVQEHEDRFDIRRKENSVAGVEARDFDSPDETRTPDKTQMAVVRMGSTTAARLTFEPGWRWSECIKPVVGTDSCQVEHVGYCISGKIHVSYADGTEADIAGGEVYRIGPGHDAWVEGNEQFVSVEFQGAANYAKPS
jgi:hypothetical protein